MNSGSLSQNKTLFGSDLFAKYPFTHKCVPTIWTLSSENEETILKRSSSWTQSDPDLPSKTAKGGRFTTGNAQLSPCTMLQPNAGVWAAGELGPRVSAPSELHRLARGVRRPWEGVVLVKADWGERKDGREYLAWPSMINGKKISKICNLTPHMKIL